MTPHRSITAPNQPARRAFTLIELMVVLVIIATLASLTLSGLAGVRQRARGDKTKSTIRKIDAVIRPMYDSYRTRRVEVPTGLQPPDAAAEKLFRLRKLMIHEMPDAWADVPTPQDFFDPQLEFVNHSWLQSATIRSYVFYSDTKKPSPMYEAAECLYMIVANGGHDPDALELFHATEVGDIDEDGAPEFWDGWGRPISFLRWAPGFSTNATDPASSLIQLPDPVNAHDPLDPWQRDASGYALIPLIYSAGPDASTTDPLTNPDAPYGLKKLTTGWTPATRPSSLTNPSYPPPPPPFTNITNDYDTVGEPVDTGRNAPHIDNITNHDLSSQ